MASTSVMQAPSGDKDCNSYHVFLSFSGEDTRHSFTDHLYHALVQAGLRTFRDDVEINKGGELNSEFKTAIKESKASVVVLSKNYATSSWCLDELHLILEQRSQCDHIVLPVFYHVDPSDVRNQRGNFAIEAKPSSSKWSDHNVTKWSTALKQVADLAGYVVSGPETWIVKGIVDTLHNMFGCKDVSFPLNVTGMATRYDDIKSWLQEYRTRCLVIWGMGGSGKTTLAKYIYNLNWRKFKYVSFVEQIGIRCEKPNGLLEVQQQLFSNILGGDERKIPSVYRGSTMIEYALTSRSALIVLDDIVGFSQLVDLLGTREINARSKIIITTRDITNDWPDLPSFTFELYKMRLLNDNESSVLLCRHAFRSEIPKAGFEEVVLQAIHYCEGNPLALQVLGSSLFKNNVESWASQLRLLEGDIDSRVHGILTRSYKSLPSTTLKELFLHIACFFNGMDMDYVAKILERDYSAVYGIQALTSRCLLSVSPVRKLMMHRLVQDMGKSIVRHESPLIEKRSRVWHNTDSYKLLGRGIGSKRIEGLALDMKMIKEENFALNASELKTYALKNMDRLKLLQLNFVELCGSFENVSEDLRWLCWFGFPSGTLPPDLFMGNLVAIDMSYSKLEVFEPPMILQSLQILNLKDSHHLTEIRNIFKIPRLETLILWNCFNLVSVCKTIEGLKTLATLNMTGCRKLFNSLNPLSASTSGGVATERPMFSLPCSLHRLFLKYCHLASGDLLSLKMNVLSSLKYLNLGYSQYHLVTCYGLVSLQVLDLSFCSRITSLIGLPSTLAELYVYDCKLLEIITFQSRQFTLQKIGYEGCINLCEVEGLLKLVPIAKLDKADLGHMKWLKTYQNWRIRLVGDELTVGRRKEIQMLYEFGIMSTSLPHITTEPKMIPMYRSESSFVSFDVPSCSPSKTLKGINVTVKYYYHTLQNDYYGWFCKISTNKGVDLMYNPKVFGKHYGQVESIWLSYWPIGNMLNIGDKVDVNIVMIDNTCCLQECGVSLVYSDEKMLKNNMEREEVVGGDLSRFQLSNGAYYLCRRDLLEMAGHDARGWFEHLFGDTIHETEIRGWRKTGRPKEVNPSFTELRAIRCIMDVPQSSSEESTYSGDTSGLSFYGSTPQPNAASASSSSITSDKPTK